MARNPWVLPDGFDADVQKAIKALVAALKKSGATIPNDAYTQLRLGNIDGFLSYVDWEKIRAGFGNLEEILTSAAQKGGTSTFTLGGVDAELLFELIDERAVIYAQERVGQLIVEITDQMRETVRDVIASAERGEMTYQMAAIQLQSTIPLTTRDANAVTKFTEKNFQRFMREGLSEARARVKAQNKAAQYAAKLLEARTKTIARTEIIDASMSGRYIGWEAGVTAGYISNDSVKEWIAEPDACPICSALDGKLIGWNQEWEFPEGVSAGSTNRMPPAHPNCRCSVVILPPDYAENVFTPASGGEMPEEAVAINQIPEGVTLNGGLFNEIDKVNFYRNYDDARNQAIIELWEEKNQTKITDAEIPSVLGDSRLQILALYSKNFKQKLASMPELQIFDNNSLERFVNSTVSVSEAGPVGTFVTSLMQANRPFDSRGFKLGGLTDEIKPLFDLPNEEIVKLASAELQDYVAVSQPVVMMPYKAIDLFLDEGTYKTSFASGTSMGAKGASAQQTKAIYENIAFGYKPNTDAALRPVYGSMVKDNNFTPVRFYGDVALVMKPAILSRSTITAGDSFNGFLPPSPATNPIASLTGGYTTTRQAGYYRQLKTMGKLDKSNNYYGNNILFEQTGGDVEAPEYVELQIHGGVNLKDVAKVILLPKSRLVENYNVDELIKRLEKLGIPWEQAK